MEIIEAWSSANGYTWTVQLKLMIKLSNGFVVRIKYIIRLHSCSMYYQW